MSVSAALEKSAKDFCSKYACEFDFDSFESSVEEFTFLSPNNGWCDVYKMMFERLYKQALEPVANGGDATLDSEAMLDDFEYTLIRPYVKEGEKKIKHEPYVGMHRVARLEYLKLLTKEAPSNFVDQYAEKYRKGELSLKQMRADLARDGKERENYVEIAGYIQALEVVSKSRSLVWKTLHPFKNQAEKRTFEQMKKTFMEQARGDEAFYHETVAAAYETFGGHQRVQENLDQQMIRAREEMDRKQKMDDMMRESLHVEGFDETREKGISPRVGQHNVSKKEKQI